MTKQIQNGQAEYGVVHVMEEEMRAAGQGVFEAHSGEAGMRRKRKPEPENKAEKAAPTNKVVVGSKGPEVISAATAGSSSRQAAKRKAK